MLIHHEIVADELAGVATGSDSGLAAFDAPDDDVFHAFLEGGPFVLADVGGELGH